MTNFAPTVQAILPGERISRLAVQGALVLGGSVLIALSSKVQVPMWPVATSLQTLAILTIAGLYGFRLATATILAYLAEGLAGYPVFQGTPEKGIGFAYMVGPTGGYLLGFAIMAMIVGWAVDRGYAAKPLRLLGAMLVSEICLLALGAAWLAILFGPEKAIAYGVGPFIVTDVVKLALAACLLVLSNRFVKRRPDRA